MTMECVQCGAEFIRKSNQICCSRDCLKDRWRQIAEFRKQLKPLPEPRKCVQCGTDFIPHDVFNKRNICCGKKCARIWQNEQCKIRQRLKFKPRAPREHTCIVCEKSFFAKGPPRKYCSYECMRAMKRKIGKERRIKKQRWCKYCDVEITHFTKPEERFCCENHRQIVSAQNERKYARSEKGKRTARRYFENHKVEIALKERIKRLELAEKLGMEIGRRGSKPKLYSDRQPDTVLKIKNKMKSFTSYHNGGAQKVLQRRREGQLAYQLLLELGWIERASPAELRQAQRDARAMIKEAGQLEQLRGLL